MKSFAIKVSNSCLFVTSQGVSIHPQICHTPCNVVTMLNQFESSLIERENIEQRLTIIQFESSDESELKDIVQFENASTQNNQFKFIPYSLWLNMERLNSRRLSDSLNELSLQ